MPTDSQLISAKVDAGRRASTSKSTERRYGGAVLMREIDPETNWFWRQGYHDGLSGERPIVPDETRRSFQRSDYFAGYDAGQEDRAAKAGAEIDEQADFESLVATIR